MFGRRSRLDTDPVAVARRRLAVLAAQFESAAGGDRPGRGDETPVAPVVTSAPSTGSGRHCQRSPARARLSIGAHHVTVVALIVVVAVVVSAWWVLRSAPEPRPVKLTNERSVPDAVTTTPNPGTPSVPTPSGGVPVSTGVAVTRALVVDVAGKVRRPGIVELPVGSRVVDALEAAGGTRPGVETAALNLARPLVDGEQVVVGLEVPSLPAPATSSTAGPTSVGVAIAPVDINGATQEQLETLPGIGPVTAQSILAWRADHGTFTSVDELLEVSGIGDATLADIEPYVYV